MSWTAFLGGFGSIRGVLLPNDCLFSGLSNAESCVLQVFGADNGLACCCALRSSCGCGFFGDNLLLEESNSDEIGQ